MAAMTRVPRHTARRRPQVERVASKPRPSPEPPDVQLSAPQRSLFSPTTTSLSLPERSVALPSPASSNAQPVSAPTGMDSDLISLVNRLQSDFFNVLLHAGRADREVMNRDVFGQVGGVDAIDLYVARLAPFSR